MTGFNLAQRSGVQGLTNLPGLLAACFQPAKLMMTVRIERLPSLAPCLSVCLSATLVIFIC